MNLKKTYEACYMPNGELNKAGFLTKEDAWEYIKSQACDGCKEDEHDLCSAEWMVFEKDYDYKEVNEIVKQCVIEELERLLSHEIELLIGSSYRVDCVHSSKIKDRIKELKQE